MDPIMVVIFFRSLERLLIIAGAVLCILLGWSLFKLPLNNEGEASIQYKNLQLALRRVGPGIFFSLFGSIILGLSFAYPVHLSAESSEVNSAKINKNLSKSASFEFSGAHEEKGNPYKNFVTSVNTAINAANSGSDPKVLNAAIGDLLIAKPHLISTRNWLIQQKLGLKAVELWKQHGDDYTRNPMLLDEKTRTELANIAPWFQDTVLNSEN